MPRDGRTLLCVAGPGAAGSRPAAGVRAGPLAEAELDPAERPWLSPGFLRGLGRLPTRFRAWTAEGQCRAPGRGGPSTGVRRF